MLSASVLLHVLVFQWANGYLSLPSLRDDQPVVITTELRAPPTPVVPPAPAAAAPKRKAKPRRPAAPPVPVHEPVADVVAALPPTVEEPASDLAATEPERPAEPAAAEEIPVEASATTPAYKIDPPPSAELAYDVQALRDGKQWHGSGMFQWTSSGNTYTITGEASITILFKITVLSFKSEGTINGFGIAPMLYSEKPWRKSMTNTHFQHEQQKISFSASEAVYPYQGGEQDRASIMWQLAGIGRGDASRFIPGATLDVVVAGARKAETWHIQVIGLEEISTGAGTMLAWHVVRAPLQGSYDQKIDMWLAPQHEWYPVKLRYTYANGDYLDMSLSELKPSAAQ